MRTYGKQTEMGVEMAPDEREERAGERGAKKRNNARGGAQGTAERRVEGDSTTGDMQRTRYIDTKKREQEGCWPPRGPQQPPAKALRAAQRRGRQ